MKSAILLGIICFMHIQGFSQTKKIANNNINLALLSNISIYSVNYEHYFSKVEKHFIATGIGLGYQEEFSIEIWDSYYTSFDRFITIPHYVSYNLGSKNNFFECGMGGTIISRTNRGYSDRKAWTGYSIYPIIGYRYQPEKKNSLNFRIHLSYPLASSMIEGDKLTDWILFIPVGGSVGWSF